MFRLRSDRLDERLHQFARARHSDERTIRGVEDLRPGFTIPDLVQDVYGPTVGYGRVTAALFRFTYWLFTGGNGIVEHLAKMGGKPVLLADVQNRPPHGPGRAFLSVDADPGVVLVPCPTVPGALLFEDPYATGPEARDALLEVCWLFVEAANAAWPAACSIGRRDLRQAED